MPVAVAEILRWTSLARWVNLTATCETELGPGEPRRQRGVLALGMALSR